MIIIDAPNVTLDEALQRFIKLTLHPNSYEYNIVLVMPKFDLCNYAFGRLQEFLGMIPGWLLLPISHLQQRQITFANGCSIRIINNSLHTRGLTITYCGMYLHQDYPWHKDDMYNIIPSIRGPLSQNFLWVTV